MYKAREDILSKASDIGVQIFSNKYFEKRRSSNPFARSVMENARLVNSDPKLIVQLSNYSNSRLLVLYIYLINIRDTKEMALQLVNLVKKEYRL